MSARRLQPLRLLASVFCGALSSLAFSATSHADAPGPTDYSSRITSIELTEGASLPDGVDISVQGHDAFLSVRVSAGTTVDIMGYEGEPYLRIGADCLVVENQRSMSTWYNRERFGSDVDRELVNHELPPDWKQVGSNCAVAWHDHRLHYMSPSAPVNAEPGDVLVIDSIPLTISGIEVEVHVESVLVKRPSRATPIATAAITAVVAGMLLWLRLTWLTTIVASFIALALGGAQYLWSAAETGPQLTLIAIPLLALVAAGRAFLARHAPPLVTTFGAQLLCGVLLAVWVWQRARVMTAALLPTSIPYFLDRAGTAVIGTVAVVSSSHAVAVLWRLASTSPTRPTQA